MNLSLSESGCFSLKAILSYRNLAARDCKSFLPLHPLLINIRQFSREVIQSLPAACPIQWFLFPPNKESDFRKNEIFRLKRFTIFLRLSVG